jgi:hypothetical protein
LGDEFIKISDAARITKVSPYERSVNLSDLKLMAKAAKTD